MRCTRVALYDIKSGTFDEVVSQAKTGMVPLFQHSDGFVSYGVAQIDKTAFVSISTWETRAQADTAATKAADWVKANSGTASRCGSTTSAIWPSTPAIASRRRPPTSSPVPRLTKRSGR